MVCCLPCANLVRLEFEIGETQPFRPSAGPVVGVTPDVIFLGREWHRMTHISRKQKRPQVAPEPLLRLRALSILLVLMLFEVPKMSAQLGHR